jgi:hypothetical protein
MLRTTQSRSCPTDRNAYKDKTLQTMVGAIDTIFFAAVTMVSVVVKTV